MASRPDDEFLARFPVVNPDPVLCIGGDGVLQFANPAARVILDIWGIEVGQVIPAQARAQLASGQVEARSESTQWTLRATDAPDSDATYLFGRNVTELRATARAYEVLARFPRENPNPVMRVTAGGVLDYANEACGPLLEHWNTQVGKPLPDHWCELLASAYATTVATFEEIMLEGVCYALNIHPVANSGYLYIYVRDVTALHIEQAKTAALARFPEENPNPVLRIDANGVLAYSNSAAHRLLDHWGVWVGDELPADLVALVVRLYGTGEALRHDVVVDDCRFALNIHPVSGAGYLNVYGKDVTQLFRQQQELHEAFGHINAMLENLGDGLLAIGMDGRVTISNPALGKLLGWGEQDPRGELAHHILPQSLSELLAATVSELSPKRVEVTLAGGRTALATTNLIRLQSELDSDDAETQLMGAVVLVRDITVEKEVDRMKTDFISMVSHELRTPLTSVLGFAMLSGKKLEQSIFPAVPQDNAKGQRAVGQVRKNIDIIVAEGQRLTTLINELLDIAKMESGQIEWEMEAIDPGKLVGRAVQAITGFMPESGLQLVVSVDEALPLITGDSARLLQVLINLLSNAVKFTDEGTITIEASHVGDAVEFSVSDSGAGIEESQFEGVFEKFKQVGNTLTGKAKGTGLGLPISKQIVKQHGGRIWVESELNIGSRFAFTIPTGVERPGATRSAVSRLLARLRREVHHLEVDRGQADVLVVDDDKHLRELLRQHLTAEGYQVRLAASGYEALAEVKQKIPDLLILDIVMPDLTGFDVAAVLKSHPKTDQIPILVLTISEDHDRGLRLGIDSFLSKPLDTVKLFSVVGELLSTQQKGRKVLLVADDPQALDTLRDELEAAPSFQVVGACEGAVAVAVARAARPDIIIVDWMTDNPQGVLHAIHVEPDLERISCFLLHDGPMDAQSMAP